MIMENNDEDSNASLRHSTKASYSSISDTLSLLNDTEAISQKKIKLDTKQWITLSTLAIGNFSIGACVSLQAPFFPAEAEKKGASPTEYGLIFGVFQLTMFLFAPVVGHLVIYMPPQHFLKCGMIIVGISCTSFGTLSLVEGHIYFVSMAFVLRILEGIGSSAVKASCLTIIASQFSDSLGTTFGILDIFKSVGLILGPTLGGLLYDVGGFGLPFFCIGCLAFLNAVITCFALPKVERTAIPETTNVLKFWMHSTVLINFLCIFSAMNFLGFIQANLEPHIRQFNLSAFQVGMFLAFSALCYAVSAPLWGWINDQKYFSSKIYCLIGVLLSTVSLLIIGPAPFLDIKLNIALVLISMVLLGLSYGIKVVSAFNDTFNDTIQRGYPLDMSTYGLISSMVASSQALGGFAGPSLGGYLVDEFGFRKASSSLVILEAILGLLLIFSLCSKR